MNQFDPKLAEAYEHVIKAQKIMTELGHTKYTLCGMVSIQMLHDSEQEVSVLLGKLNKSIKQRDILSNTLEEILSLVPTASCDMFHHSKKDRHDYGEECKPLARYNSKIKKAEEELMIAKAEK
jgi:hypothetical protein